MLTYLEAAKPHEMQQIMQNHIPDAVSESSSLARLSDSQSDILDMNLFSKEEIGTAVMLAVNG